MFRQAGCGEHKYHPKVDPDGIPFPTRLLHPQQIQEIEQLGNSCVNTGVGRNFVYSKYGSYLSNQKISFLFNQSTVKIEEDTTDIDHLLSYFESTEDVSYHCLWDVVPKEFQQPNEIDLTSNEPNIISKSIPSSPSRLMTQTKVSMQLT